MPKCRSSLLDFLLKICPVTFHRLVFYTKISALYIYVFQLCIRSPPSPLARTFDSIQAKTYLKPFYRPHTTRSLSCWNSSLSYALRDQKTLNSFDPRCHSISFSHPCIFSFHFHFPLSHTVYHFALEAFMAVSSLIGCHATKKVFARFCLYVMLCETVINKLLSYHIIILSTRLNNFKLIRAMSSLSFSLKTDRSHTRPIIYLTSISSSFICSTWLNNFKLIRPTPESSSSLTPDQAYTFQFSFSLPFSILSYNTNHAIES